ncbi:hypothetical protein RI103_06095 [Paraburkholderia sp. FT54]|uniref:hypothetical protein n=1 Tax=Paraburkholderia sp. FT54 TaxID=3074437 RepID=UPI0028772CCC|nr:hypothetical protein [Paraburkholderia sp. FT54]WNC90918.1 hypothetical protein RI103_06095 [Paraburkholderia sp. FT54]
MYTALDLCLAVLGSLWLGVSISVIVGGMNRVAKRADESSLFHVPAAHQEFEHESDAHFYPRIGD